MRLEERYEAGHGAVAARLATNAMTLRTARIPFVKTRQTPSSWNSLKSRAARLGEREDASHHEEAKLRDSTSTRQTGRCGGRTRVEVQSKEVTDGEHRRLRADVMKVVLKTLSRTGRRVYT